MIRKNRKIHGYTQEKLSKKLGITRSYLSKIENRDFNNITLYLFIKICKVLKLNKYNLLDWLHDCEESQKDITKLTENEKTLLELYRQLSIVEQAELRRELKATIKFKKKQETKKEQRNA